jgi:HrpA-like RNA helicase
MVLIISSISSNQVIVVAGETGCGKTTQLPAYIFEVLYYYRYY